MLSESDLVHWLESQPIDEPVNVDGETVLLKNSLSGSTLIGLLLPDFSEQQLRRAMEQGFAHAIEFEAGLGISADGGSLILTQWLPYVSTWMEAARPLENLLNQLASWRTALAPPPVARVTTKNTTNRNEQRLRIMFAGENS